MKSGKVKTYFDTPEKDPHSKILLEFESFTNDEEIVQVFEGYPDLALVLNKYRQIIYCNLKALKIFNTTNQNSVIGKRFGEALNCIHQNAFEGGCGTSKFCGECGAAKAIKESIENMIHSEKECRIAALKNGEETAFDFVVSSQPFHYNNKNYFIIAIRDISGDKRRENYERLFFHDVLNTATAVSGLASLLPTIDSIEQLNEIQTYLIESSNILLNQIIAQREIKSAEEKSLIVKLDKTTVNSILKYFSVLYSKHVKGKSFTVEFIKKDIEFVTDYTLLARSIENLLKNAFEATREKGTIKLYTINKKNSVSLNVFNDAVIPEVIQLQLFQRSFSTKSNKGRGLGLYSAKLLVEQYLDGKISFISDKENKTVFSIKIPRNKILNE
jgi:K+-sensing histidine kinase KdpD